MIALNVIFILGNSSLFDKYTFESNRFIADLIPYDKLDIYSFYFLTFCSILFR